jgi:hypothetical protein
MTLTGIQQSIIKSAGNAVDKLHRAMNPLTYTKRVVVTLEFDIEVTVEEAEQENGFDGRHDYQYDSDKVKRQLHEKIEEQLAP